MSEKKKFIKVENFASDNNLHVITGREFLNNKITVEMINRPAVEICGIFDFMDNERVILIGVKESKVMLSYNKKKQDEIACNILNQNPPAIVFSFHDIVKDVAEIFKRNIKNYKVPLLQSDLKTTPLTSLIYYYLHDKLAPSYTEHGVLVDIYGLGTLILGESGTGKSECAVELVKKGHILVADDIVEIRETTPGYLLGTAPKILKRFLEIRGIGIVDIIGMHGVSSFRSKKRIKLVVQLEKWDKNKEYDRIGLETETITYFNTTIPKITIPILLGRNVSSLVESAAMNQKLKNLGHNAALNFTNEVARLAGRNGDLDE